jgi:hypothetical protein
MRHKSFLLQLATAVLLAWCLSCGESAAEVHVSGTPDRIVLQASEATMPEILAALRSTFDLQVTLKGGTARQLTGAYSGSLRQVLSRLLKGEDYVLRSTSGGVSVILFGSSAADSTVTRRALALPAAPGSRLVALRQARQGAAPEKPR